MLTSELRRRRVGGGTQQREEARRRVAGGEARQHCRPRRRKRQSRRSRTRRHESTHFVLGNFLEFYSSHPQTSRDSDKAGRGALKASADRSARGSKVRFCFCLLSLTSPLSLFFFFFDRTDHLRLVDGVTGRPDWLWRRPRFSLSPRRIQAGRSEGCWQAHQPAG